MADLRVKKTEKAIQDAFVDMVLEAGFKNLTISGLAKRAMINRQTFYKHYDDKYDLAHHITLAILAWYDQLGKARVNLAQSGLKVAEIIEILRPNLEKLVKTYRKPILALRTIPLAEINIDSELKKRIAIIVAQLFDHKPSEFERQIVESVVFGMVDYILEHGELLPTDEIAAGMHEIGKLFN